MIRRLILWVGLLAVLLAGCGSSPSEESAPGQSAEQAIAPALPASVSIRSISAESSLVPLGKKDDGTLEVPPINQPGQASWYERSPVPGMTGPAVILGHINGRVNGVSRPGVFTDLAKMKIGDIAEIVDQDGAKRSFVVYRIQQAKKNAFPALEVFGDTSGPELRLITCGGPFVGGDLGYSENTIVYLRLS